MQDNVIQFPVKRKAVEILPEVRPPVDQFIDEHLFPWAEQQGIDMTSSKFKHTAAAIMACLQGMLLNVE